MNSKIALFSILWVTSFIPHLAIAQDGAGGGVGNGGGAVVCRDAEGTIIKPVETMDRYEARTQRGLRPRFTMSLEESDLPNERLEFFTGEIFKRLAKYSPIRAKEYSEWAKNFFNEANFLKDQTLTDVPDSEHLSVPVGCRFEQLVIQRLPEFPEDSRYTINGDLWHAMKPVDRAIIIVHEMMVREMIETHDRCRKSATLMVCPEVQTKEVRYLNSLLFSDKISIMKFEEFDAVVRKVQNFGYDENPKAEGKLLRR